MSRFARYCTALLAVMATAGIAHARIFTVNDRGDATDATPGDGFCRTATGVCTLRAAVQEANAWAGADRINLSLSGLYALAINGAGEDAAATGDLDITTVIDIYNMSGSTITIGAGGLTPRDRVFHVLNGSLGLHDVTVTNGSAPLGGCILNQNSKVNLDDVTVSGCTAGSDGGAIRSTGPQARVTIVGSTLIGNSASNNGGAISNEAQSTLSVSDTDFKLNTANNYGGAIYNHVAGGGLTGGLLSQNRSSNGGAFANVDGTFTLTSADFDANIGATGGAIYQNEQQGLPMLTLTLVHATNNTAENGAGGGGLYARHGSLTVQQSDFISNATVFGPGGGIALDPETGITMSITQTNVSQNTSRTNGGGIAYFGDGDLIDITESTIDNNTADGNGGGIWALQASGGTMKYSTVSTNSAANGGGLWLQGTNAAIVTLSDSTIAFNNATVAGGGVYTDATGSFRSYQTIVARSTGGVDDCGGPGALTSIGFTLLENLGACNYTAAGGDRIGLNPLLGGLALNGTARTPTHAILRASPAFNRGSAANCGPLDQAAQTAPVAGVCDIGAFEAR